MFEFELLPFYSHLKEKVNVQAAKVNIRMIINIENSEI